MKDMVELPGGTFRMGSEHFYPEEAAGARGDGRRLLRSTATR